MSNITFYSLKLINKHKTKRVELTLKLTKKTPLALKKNNMTWRGKEYEEEKNEDLGLPVMSRCSLILYLSIQLRHSTHLLYLHPPGILSNPNFLAIPIPIFPQFYSCSIVWSFFQERRYLKISWKCQPKQVKSEQKVVFIQPLRPRLRPNGWLQYLYHWRQSFIWKLN